MESVEIINWGYGLYLHYRSGTPQITLEMDSVSCTGNAVGFQIGSGFPAGFFQIENCRAAANVIGFQAYSDVAVNWCEIQDNSDYDVKVQTSVTNYPSLDFQYNDWGPNTTMEMGAEGLFSDIESIYDWWDENSRSLVDYSGYEGGGTAVKHTSWGDIKSMFR